MPSKSSEGLSPVYLIVGPDALKRKSMRRRLESHIAELGCLELNMEAMSGEAADAAQVVNACNMMPFASSKRLVILEDADKMSASGQKILADYCKLPNSSTVLALFCTKLSERSVLYKAVESLGGKCIISCDVRGKRDMPAYVARIAASHGVSIDPQAANLLVDLVGESSVGIDSEIAKLSAVPLPDKRIDVELVETMVTRSISAKPWELADAMSCRDIRAVVGVFSRMDAFEPLAMLSNCVKRIRELIVARSMSDSGQADLKALAQKTGRRDWQVKHHFSWAGRFKPGELEESLVEAACVEGAIKTGADANSAFRLWVIGVCTGIYA